MRKYCLALDLPKEIKEKIVQLQHQFQYNVSPGSLEPHITVKHSLGLDTTLEWLLDVKNVCKATNPFQVTLSNTSYFGNEVLHLSVLSKQLKDFHNQLVGCFDYPLPEKHDNFELDCYIPHSTLGISGEKMTFEDLLLMQKEAEQMFPEAITFQVNELVLWGKQDLWKIVEKIPLGV